MYWRARNLPAWSEHDPVAYFTAAETGERVKGVAYTEWRFNVPREMTRREQMATARDVLQASFGDTHPYVWALHDARAADGGRNVHVHVLWSARTIDGIDRTEEHFFRRYNAAHPERGGARKDLEMNHMGAVKAARVQYVDIVNAHLEHGGYEARLHPDSLQARGIDREPEPKLLPSDSNKLKHHFVVTDRMQEVFTHRHARAQSAPAERADAQAYWQRRQVELGISRDMPIDQQLQRIREAREQAISRVPERVPAHELAHQAYELQQSIGGLERYSNQLRNEHAMEMHFREDYQRPQSGQRSAERVLAEGKEHGLPRDAQAERAVAQFARSLEQLSHEQEPQVGGALNVRIFREEERERDQGWGF